MKKPLAAIALLVLAGLVSESALRLAYFVNPEWEPCREGYLRFLPAPGVTHFGHRLNSGGFNDSEHDDAKSPGRFRILAVGDSIFFSVMPRRLSAMAVIQNRFAAEGRNVEIINMGIPSIGPRDYHSLLINQGIRKNPDLVLVSFYVGDDLCEGKANRMLAHIRLFGFLDAVFRKELNAAAGGPGKEAFCPGCPTFDAKTFGEIESSRIRFFRKDGDFAGFADLTASYYRKIKRICDRRGIPMLVVIVPAEMQLYPELRREAMALAGVTADRCDFMLPNRIMAEKFTGDGIPFVDLTLPMAEKARGGSVRLYKPRDTHWNIEGNLAFAGLLHDVLADRIDAFISPVAAVGP